MVKISALPDGSAAAGGAIPMVQTGVTVKVTLGLMAYQAASAVAITGGTINGAVIGGVTPAAGTFTTGLFTTNLSPSANDGAALGSTTLGWADAFFASGGTIHFADTDWVATHTAGILTVGTGDLRVTNAGTNAASAVTVGGSQTLTGKQLTAATVNTSFTPTANDGSALGSATLGFADLFGATGFTWNIANGNWLATHSSGIMTVTTGDLRVTNNFTNATSVVTLGGAQTLTSKTLTSPVIGTGIQPTANDAAALGVSGTAFADLFLASGGVINWNAGNYTITHTAGLLTLNGALSIGTGNAFTCGTIELGAASDTTISRSAAGVIAVEGLPLFAGIPQNSQSTAYTTVLADAQKHILHPTADNNARTFTIAANASVAYPIGTCITFVNEINTLTIAINSDTMTLAGTGTTGSRTLAAAGIATALKLTSTTWIISGVGLT